MTPLPIGIIGCGTLTRSNYLKSLPRVPAIRVVAVHDRDPAAAAAAATLFGAEAVDLDGLCSRARAVIVATPPATHRDLVQACLARGMTVVCEKPFVGSVEQARALITDAHRLGLGLYVGHLRRTFGPARLARDLIGTRSLGAVQRLDITEGGRFSWEAASGYVTSDQWGGVLFDTGSHTIDLALFTSGLDDAVMGVSVSSVRRDRPEPAHEISAEGELQLAGGTVPFHLHLSRHRVLANRVRITLEHGTMDVPVGPRDRIRLTGPAGSCIVRTGKVSADFNDYFVAQWSAIFSAEDGERFRADHFVGLTAVLEAIAAREEHR